MTIRPYRPSDAPALAEMAEESGFPYIDAGSPLVESCLVVENDAGRILGAVTANRIVELYLHKRRDLHPVISLAILKQMHFEMANALRVKGYTEANAFLPPSICERFGRRLQRTFGWVRNWPSLAVKF